MHEGNVAGWWVESLISITWTDSLLAELEAAAAILPEKKSLGKIGGIAYRV